MKLFYMLTLLVGIMMAVVVQFVTFALPKDAYIASRLSGAPEQWSIQMDEKMATILSHHDVKTELVTALHNRALSHNDIYKLNIREGLALIVLSIIGLIRERKIQQPIETEPA